MAAGHLVNASGLAPVVQDYLKEEAEVERKFLLPMSKDAQHERINKGNGYVFAWHTWPKVGLAQKPAYGTDLTTGKTWTPTQAKSQLRPMADFVSLDPLGEDTRIDKVADVAYRQFREQVQRTTWEWQRGGIVIGSGYYGTAAGHIASGSETWTTPTKYFAGGATTRAALIDLGTTGGKLKADDFLGVRGKLGRVGAPRFDDGTYHGCISEWTLESILKDDAKFRELYHGGKLTPFEDYRIIRWANMTLYVNDMPYRENSQVAASDGSNYNFDDDGDLIYDFVYGDHAFADVVLGAGGQKPEFKVQDIAKIPNAEITIGWSMPYATGVPRAEWIFPIGSLVDAGVAADTSL